MSKPSLTIKPKAYYKMLLHCMKHPTSDCYGFFLGTTSSNGTTYIIEDTIPFTHDKLLSPPFTLFIKMLQTTYPSSKIIGLYENSLFNQMKSDCDITSHAIYLSNLIHTNSTPHPILIEIHSKDDGSSQLTDTIFIRKFRFNDKGGFDDMGFHKESDEEYETLSSYITNHLQNDIIDFDDHLLNANSDWRNQWIV